MPSSVFHLFAEFFGYFSPFFLIFVRLLLVPNGAGAEQGQKTNLPPPTRVDERDEDLLDLEVNVEVSYLLLRIQQFSLDRLVFSQSC